MEKETGMKIERYYMKTRDLRYEEGTALLLGIKRIYNYTSDIDYMDDDHLREWSHGLYRPGRGEAVLVESALREIEGTQLYVMSCIVFHNIESCNLYFFRHQKSFRKLEGFYHLYN
jgi:hypothetical protein